jgi:putative ABC transport system permease protein
VLAVGIIIGVLTIIAVVSVIQGLNNYVYTKMAFFGANDFSVQKFSMMGTSLKDFKEQLKRKDLTMADVEILRRECRDPSQPAPLFANRTVKFGSQSRNRGPGRHLDHEIAPS